MGSFVSGRVSEPRPKRAAGAAGRVAAPPAQTAQGRVSKASAFVVSRAVVCSVRRVSGGASNVKQPPVAGEPKRRAALVFVGVVAQLIESEPKPKPLTQSAQRSGVCAPVAPVRVEAVSEPR